jgi:hypothetical protein
MMLIEKYRRCVAMVDRHQIYRWQWDSRKRKSWIAKRDRAGRQLKRLWARL